MYIYSDHQTLNDLSIIEHTYGSRSIFSIYDKASSDGGKRVIKKWLETPLNNQEKIIERLEAVQNKDVIQLRINREELDFIEYYLDFRDKPTSLSPLNSFLASVLRIFISDADRYVITRGTQLLFCLLTELIEYTKEVTEYYPSFFRQRVQMINDIIESTELSGIVNETIKGTQDYKTDCKDYLFRYKKLQTIREILNIVYEFDAIYTLTHIMKERNFCIPSFTVERKIVLNDFYHPHLKSPVKNTWEMEACNVCVFTGSNMAGKSTTLKSIATAVWLAHCGFPIPAYSLQCCLFDGIYTSINLPDSLLEGRSHFYAEVIRVKEILQKIEEGKNCFVLFDELFRGTNARDAFESSQAVVGHLKLVKNSFFIISTHIIELAKAYENDPSCCFYFLESEIVDDEFICRYLLRKGMSESRVGFWIVKKEIIK